MRKLELNFESSVSSGEQNPPLLDGEHDEDTFEVRCTIFKKTDTRSDN